MSKKQSTYKQHGRRKVKQKQKQRLPWIVLAFGGIMLAFAVILFVRQAGGDEGGTPSIAVDQQQIDYGDQHFGTNLTFEIKVTNTGDGALRFKDQPYIEVLEGC